MTRMALFPAGDDGQPITAAAARLRERVHGVAAVERYLEIRTGAPVLVEARRRLDRLRPDRR